MRIETALEKFLVQLEADGRSAHTIGQYSRHVRLFAQWLAKEGRSRSVGRIDHEDLACFLVSPEARTRPDGKQKKATSTNALRTSVRCFFAYLHRAGVIRQDPARLVRRAICAPPPPRALTQAEEKRLLRVLRQARGPEGRRDRVLFEVMLRTGIRLSSALGLDAEDVDLDEGILELRRAKGDRVERVYLDSTTRKLLKKHLAHQETGPVFASQSGARLSARHVQRRFGRWRQEAAISRWVTCHALRHTFATRLLARTGDLVLVQRALTHASITSTTTYLRCDDVRLRKAMGV